MDLNLVECMNTKFALYNNTCEAYMHVLHVHPNCKIVMK